MVSAHIVRSNNEVIANFKPTIQPARGFSNHGMKIIESTMINVLATQKGLKKGDQKFFDWYI